MEVIIMLILCSNHSSFLVKYEFRKHFQKSFNLEECIHHYIEQCDSQFQNVNVVFVLQFWQVHRQLGFFNS